MAPQRKEVGRSTYYEVSDERSTYWVLSGKSMVDTAHVWKVQAAHGDRPFYLNLADRTKTWHLPDAVAAAAAASPDDDDTPPPPEPEPLRVAAARPVSPNGAAAYRRRHSAAITPQLPLRPVLPPPAAAAAAAAAHAAPPASSSSYPQRDSTRVEAAQQAQYGDSNPLLAAGGAADAQQPPAHMTIHYLWVELQRAAAEADEARAAAAAEQARCEQLQGGLESLALDFETAVREITELRAERDHYQMQLASLNSEMGRLTDAFEAANCAAALAATAAQQQQQQQQLHQSSLNDSFHHHHPPPAPLAPAPLPVAAAAAAATGYATPVRLLADTAPPPAPPAAAPAAAITQQQLIAPSRSPQAVAAAAASALAVPPARAAAPAAPSFFPKKALLLGLGYAHLSDPFVAVDEIGKPVPGAFRHSGGVHDLKRMEAYLCASGFSPPAALCVLSDDVPDATLRPTKANILAGVDWLSQEAAPGDQLFMQIKGWGVSVEGDGCVLPADCTTAGVCRGDTLLAALSRLPLGVRLLVVADTAQDGALFDLSHQLLGIGGDAHARPQWVTRKGFPLSADVTVVTVVGDHATERVSVTQVLLEALERFPNGTFSQVLQAMKAVLSECGLSRCTPVVSSNREFEHTDPFPCLGAGRADAAAPGGAVEHLPPTPAAPAPLPIQNAAVTPVRAAVPSVASTAAVAPISVVPPTERASSVQQAATSVAEASAAMLAMASSAVPSLPRPFTSLAQQNSRSTHFDQRSEVPHLSQQHSQAQDAPAPEPAEPHQVLLDAASSPWKHKFKTDFNPLGEQQQQASKPPLSASATAGGGRTASPFDMNSASAFGFTTGASSDWNPPGSLALSVSQ